MRKSHIIALAGLTLIGFPTIAFIINRFTTDIPFYWLFETKTGIWRELLIGMVYGTLAGLIGLWIVERPFLRDTKNKFVRLFMPFKLNLMDVIFISICAGVGEEILFRGAIQPHLGVEVTAVLFVAIHGYLNPWNWRMSIYGIFMTAVIIGIGYLAQKEGLTSAMTAHAFIDIVLLYRLTTIKLPEDHLSDS